MRINIYEYIISKKAFLELRPYNLKSKLNERTSRIPMDHKTYLWNSLGKSRDPHFRCCRMVMCFFDRFEWLCKAFTRASFRELSLGTKLSRRTQLSIFIAILPLVYLCPLSPCWRRSNTILLTASPLLESCIIDCVQIHTNH